ncbi:MAG: chitobiase/beta-hexosaminidase C-terminal domain-containing protein [Oscillospiraceae bacterium]|nr:chitobiase/beta-hexosaminidase C-terminal domain-containing protein [Oscillospiraceae bacterium]
MKKIKHIIVLLLVFTIIFAAAAPAMAADETVLTISGNGVLREISFTRAELYAMTEHFSRHAYSAWNTWPTRSVYFVEGVDLAHLLSLAGLRASATTINVAERPQAPGVAGFNATFLLDSLFADRFTFEGTRTRVPTILAFRQSQSSFAEMEDTNLRLIFGQLSAQEQTTMGFVRSASIITVTNDPVRQLSRPQATAERQSDGRYSVTLTSDNTSAKIHYTTNGQTPTVHSTMFNVSAAHWQPQLNVPFTVSGDTVVRAIAVAPGFADSEELRFTPASLSSAGSGNNGSIDPGMANFVRMNSYRRGQFSDVNENAWFGLNQGRVIADTFEFGLMRGTSANAFNPSGHVTLAEAIAIASRVHSIYSTGSADFTQSNPWHQVYVNYAVANGLITAGAFPQVGRAATRAEMAFIFSRTLPQSEFPAQNTVNALPDVNRSTPHQQAIFTLYRAGVLTGNDARGTFAPGESISRAEAAAIISRIIQPDTRASGRVF